MHQDENQSLSNLHRLLDALRNPYFQLFRNHQPVYHNFNIMDLVTVYLHFRNQVFEFAIHPYLHKTLLAGFFKKLPVMPFSAPYKRSKYRYLPAGKFTEQVCHNFFITEFDHLLPRMQGIGIPCTGVEETQKIIYFRNRAYC